VAPVEQWPPYRAEALVNGWSQTLELDSESPSQGNRAGDVFGKSSVGTGRAGKDPAYVFIGGPSEMQPHRDAIRRYLEELNKNEGRQLSRMFLPLDWQHDSTSGAERAQKRITEQVLEPNKEQIVLMIFLMGSRIGSPTGTFQSGTLEEYEWGRNRRAETKTRWPEIKWCFEPFDWKGMEGLAPEEQTKRMSEMSQVTELRSSLKTSDSEFLTEIKSKETYQQDVLADLKRWIWLKGQPWAPKQEVPEQRDVGFSSGGTESRASQTI